MLSCSIQNVLLSFLLSRHVHNIFTASVHREFEPTQHSEIAIPSLSEKGEGLERGPTGSTALSSWHHCKQTPDVAVVCPLNT